MNTINGIINPYSAWMQAQKTASAQAGGFLEKAIKAAGTSAASEAEKTEGTSAVSLESMLKEKYGNVVYHVFDASSSYWRTRNDYPHYLLYQEGDAAAKELENWRPSGPNPFYGSIDGRFTAPKEIRALQGVPSGMTAVVIHPDVQKRMEENPAYAKEIMARIDAWFTFDQLRNEAMIPGISARSSRAIAIGADGEIANAQSFSHGRITFSTSGEDSTDWWDLRMSRQAEYMRRRTEDQIAHKLQLSDWAAASAAANARAEVLQMMESGSLKEALGGTVAGCPVEELFASTRAFLSSGGSFWG